MEFEIGNLQSVKISTIGVNRLEEVIYTIENLEKVKNINELIELFIQL